MTSVKRNLWAPQSYLKAFAADPEQENIWQFSKESGVPELKPIASVSQFQYGQVPQDAAGQRDYSFELQLSKLAKWFGSPLWRLLLAERVDLGDEAVRKLVSLLTAVMYLRDPKTPLFSSEVRRKIGDFVQVLAQPPQSFTHKGESCTFDSSGWDQLDAGNEKLRDSWMASLKEASWLAAIIMKMRWSIVVSDQPGFITTDHPVTVIHPSLAFMGFSNPETIVILPLSPQRLLVMDHRFSEPPGQYYSARDTLPSWNASIWSHAADCMFSSRHPTEVLAELVTNARNRKPRG